MRFASSLLVLSLFTIAAACSGKTVTTLSDAGTENDASAVPTATGTSSASPEAGTPICTPGAYVFCRCASSEEGTKLCQPDGKSFGPCQPCE